VGIAISFGPFVCVERLLTLRLLRYFSLDWKHQPIVFSEVQLWASIRKAWFDRHSIVWTTGWPSAKADAKQSVGKTINSPLLPHKTASSLSLIRMFVPLFADAYLRLNLKLTH
jgi:hypothetical protein